MLKMHKRIEVYNNYISTISNKLHTINLIDRLKKSEPHNAAHYQAELGRLLVHHDDVIDWVLNIMKTDDYYRQVEELPVVDPLTAYNKIQHYPGLFDMQQVMCRITTKADVYERQLCRRGRYPICDSPVPTTSGFVPHRPSPTFKLIDPVAPTPASGSVSAGQGSAQHNSPATNSSLPCGQCTPQGTSTTSSQQSHKGMSNHILNTPNSNVTSPQQTAAHSQQFAMPSHNTPPQNVASWQPSAQAPQPLQQSPVVHQQQQPLFQPPAPASQAAHLQQDQLPFIQPRVGPQGQHIRQQRHSSPFVQNFNPSAQPFIPAVEAQQNSVPNTQEPRVPKLADGKGVKNSSATDKVCFQSKQPEHLKKDCPEPPYCFKCRTKGHIPAKCPLTNQDKQQQNKRCESNQETAEKHESHREDWKKAQDQPQFSNPDNRCLNCAGNHRTHDCPMRQQHQAPPINNPVNGQGINNSPSHFTHQSPQQQLQQNQSTGQNHRQPTPPIQHLNQQVRPPTLQYNQYQVPQASPLLAQPQYNRNIPPPYPGQWQQQAPSVQSNHSDNKSDVSQIKQEQWEYFKFMKKKEEA